MLYLRHVREDGALHAQVGGDALIQADGGKLFHLQYHVPLVQGRHESLADEGINRAGAEQHGDRAHTHPFAVAQGPVQQGSIERMRLAHQPWILVRTGLEEPGRQHGNDREREQQGAGQREHDSERHRHEELALQPLQGKQRHEDDDDDEHARHHRHDHLQDRPVDHMQLGQIPRAAIMRQVGDDVFHHHHGAVHQHADGDRQPAEAHEIGGEAELAHEQEGDKRGQRQRCGHHHGSTQIAEEKHQQHQHEHDGLGKRFRYRAHCPLHQRPAVVEGHQLHTGRQGALDFCKLGLHLGYDLARIRAAQPQHQPFGGFLAAVTRDRAIAREAAEFHLGDFSHAHGHALHIGDDDIAHVVERADRPLHPHHQGFLAAVDASRTVVAVVARQGLFQAGQLQTTRCERPAVRSHFEGAHQAA